METNEIPNAPDELAALKARADLLGIPYHPSIGVEKLREKVNAVVLADDPDNDEDNDNTGSGDKGAAAEQGNTPSQDPQEPVMETENEMRARRRAEATALVRIRVACMNPNKKEWEGEIITAGNSAIGTHKKYVPFNAEEGWHVPRIILNQLLSRECQVFTTKTNERGMKVRVGKMIKEFAIEILPPLTEKELAELARRQAMAKSVD